MHGVGECPTIYPRTPSKEEDQVLIGTKRPSPSPTSNLLLFSPYPSPTPK